MPFDRLAALENRLPRFFIHGMLNPQPFSDVIKYSLDTPRDIPELLESDDATKDVSPQLRGIIKRLE